MYACCIFIILYVLYKNNSIYNVFYSKVVSEHQSEAGDVEKADTGTDTEGGEKTEGEVSGSSS